MRRRTFRTTLLLLAAALALCVPPVRAAEQPASALFSAGPGNATVEATVTRPGFPRPLSASLVPFLKKGDRIRIRFPSSERSPGPAAHRFHALLAFIGLAATFEKPNDPGYSLFHARGPNDGREIDFTYDPERGTPVIFLFPEDKKTRGVDGVRDYVLEHPAQFLGSATIAATADDRAVWFHDFVTGLSEGNIGDPQGGHAQIAGLARTFGVTDNVAVDACYQEYSPDKSAVGRCILQLVQEANPPNFFSASNLGAIPASFVPVTASAYVVSVGLLASLWNQIRDPKRNYQFIPATLKYVPASAGLAGLAGSAAHQALVPVEPARWNPPSGVSSALFFTIGRSSYDGTTDPQPAITDTDPSMQAVCLLGSQASLPLQLNRASIYVRDVALSVYRAGSDDVVKTIPMEAATASAPVLTRAEFAPGAYDVSLAAAFGFGELTSPRKVRVVRPAHQSWATEKPLKIVAGVPRTTLTFTSPFAPCVTSADLVDSSLASTPADVRLDSPDRVTLRFDTSSLTPGDATVRIHQGSIEDTVRYFAALPYPKVSSPPVVYDGDRSILLSGQRLQLIRSVTLKNSSGKTLLVLPREAVVPAYRADGTAARFVARGGHIALAEQPAILQLSYYDGRPSNEVPVKVEPGRPAIRRASVTSLAAAGAGGAAGAAGNLIPLERGIVFSPGSAVISVTGPPGTVYPEKATLRLRKASLARVYGDGATTTTLPTVRQADGQTLQGQLDLSTALGAGLSERVQVQVYDPQRKVGSDWVTLEPRFIPSATIDEIDCPVGGAGGGSAEAADASGASGAGPCEMFGRNLDRIKDVSDGTATSVPVPCPASAQAERGCVRVANYTRYIVTMFGTAPMPRFRVSDRIVKRGVTLPTPGPTTSPKSKPAATPMPASSASPSPSPSPSLSQ